MRERAAALLKVASGIPGHQVALHGLFKPRDPDTVYSWIHRYQASGIDGLSIKPGRGRKPAYAPRYQDKEEAKTAILNTVRREPSTFGLSSSRWSLGLIARVCDWLQVKNPSSLSQLLKRLGISYKRGRSYVHSPDKNYQQKMDMIAQCLLRAWYAPQKYALLYQDEFTIYRQPTVDRNYEAKGKFQPLAHWSHQSNTEFRGIGALNAVTGQVTYHQASKANITQLTRFYDMVVADYPDLDTIYMVQDNWPVHFHPDLLIHLQPQHFQFPIHVPGHWPKEPSPQAKRKAEKRKTLDNLKHEKLPIIILQLPTYASWANPIEKLWRWVRQSVLHMHRLSDEWHRLKQRVVEFMLSFRKGSNQLLRYVGLLPD
jgi:transposase